MTRHTIFDAAHVFQQLAAIVNGKIGLWIRKFNEADFYFGVICESSEATKGK